MVAEKLYLQPHNDSIESRPEKREISVEHYSRNCSVHRPEILSETVDSLVHRQSVPPREIIISVVNQDHVAEKTRAYPTVRVVTSSRQGTCAQRNVAAKLVRAPYTLFLDDDVELASNYIQSMERLLYEDEGVVAATGFLTVDGAQGDVGLNREIARSYVRTIFENKTTIITKTANLSLIPKSSSTYFSMKIFHSMAGLRTSISLPTSSAMGESS